MALELMLKDDLINLVKDLYIENRTLFNAKKIEVSCNKISCKHNYENVCLLEKNKIDIHGKCGDIIERS